MAFTQSDQAKDAPTGGTRVLGGCWSVMCLAGRATLSLLTLAVLVAGLFYVRLLNGPVELSGLASVVEEAANAGSQNVRVEVGSVVISLGEDGLSSGVRLKDVGLTDAAGGLLVAIQDVGLELAIADIIHGRVQPRDVTVFAPDAVLIRLSTGGLKFTMGEGQGIIIAPDGSSSTVSDTALTAEAETDPTVFPRFLAALAGDAPLPTALERLERIVVKGAKLTFVDHLNGGVWNSQGARISLTRNDTGVRGTVSVAVIDDGQPGAAVRLSALRRKGGEDILLAADFGRIRTQVMSGQLPSLAWLGVLDGTIEGHAEAVINANGEVTAVVGELISENGRLTGLGDASAFDIAEVSFAVDPVAGLLTLNHVAVSAPALDTQLTGVAALRLTPDGDPSNLAGQLDVGSLHLRLPDLFAEPLAFDDGQVTFRWDTSTNTISIADTRLSEGPLSFQVDGRIVPAGEGWITDIRAQAINMTVQDLISHWPYVAATNARSWVAENITEADVDTFLAQMRFGDGEPQLSLDFEYSNLTSTYIQGMPPIEGATGRGHMSYHALFLEMDDGSVTPSGGQPISLAGSSVDIEDFWGIVTPASVNLTADGRAQDVLALINQQPLGLVDKLDVDLGRVGGRAQVTAALDFPLISDLLVEDVGADARAVLTRFSMPFDLDGTALAVASDRLVLEANTRAMRLRGPVRASGAPLNLDWRENYGTTPSRRTLTLAGRTSDELLAAVGSDSLPFDGRLPFELTLTQAGSGAPAFQLTADLTPVRLSIAALDWVKPEGLAGRLSAGGTLAGALAIDAFDIRAGGLIAKGSAAFGAEGSLARARLDRLVVPGLADVAGSFRIAEDGVPEIDLTGGSLDVSDMLESEGTGDDTPPVRASFVLDRLAVSDKIIFGQTRGSFEQRSGGFQEGSLNAVMQEGTPVAITITTDASGRRHLGLATNDAGAVLQAADLYRGASGGRLVLDAVFGGAGERDIWGRARIEDVVVRSEATFRDVLRDGGLSDAQSAVSGDGIRFRKVWIPFAYEDGVITVEDAVATSPALALKINGTLNEATESLDLVGVLSPAYVLTGALNEVPVLGQILSGGEGEGILAMTFSLKGKMRDPSLSVNPLSLLAPGFLRRIFTGRSRVVSDGFQDQLTQPDR